MATNFPTSVDALTNPTSVSTLNNPSHSGQHANANDAIEAIETILVPAVNAWTSYTPVAKLGSTTLTSGGSTTGLYIVLGKMVTVMINDSTYLTGSRAVEDVNISLPFATTGGTFYGTGYLAFQDGSGAYYYNTATVYANGSTVKFLRNDVQETYISPTRTNDLSNFGTMNSSFFTKNCTITYQKA